MTRRLSQSSGTMVGWLAGAVLTAAGAVGVLTWPEVTHAQQPSTELHIMPVRGNVFMIVGGGSNVTVSAGVDGMLLVDAGSAAMAGAAILVCRAALAAGAGLVTVCAPRGARPRLAALPAEV